MKEQIHTVPVNEAFLSGDECPFCYLERKAEQSALRYVAGPGASYMEPEVRAVTDKVGFCRVHMKKLYDFGNSLGSALILQTHYAELLDSFRKEAEKYEIPPKKGLLTRKKQPVKEAYPTRITKQVDACYICDKTDYNMERYFHTFFVLLKDEEFRARVENSKGFCMRHFGQMLEMAEDRLPNSQREWFYPTAFSLMKDNLIRVKEDLDWLIAKYDYRNASADWKQSKDALQRAMQKVEGLYPADPPYKNE